jgi:hypothetical protein
MKPLPTMLALSLLSAPALAADKDFSTAITISPLHLVSPIVEITVEKRASENLGVAGIAGAGTSEEYRVWELGVSGRYYLLGDFASGLQLGAEAVYVHINTGSSELSGSGLSVGPFVGGKWTANSGFTLDGQLGAQYVGTQASSGSTSASEYSLGPLLNLNLGWSL